MIVFFVFFYLVLVFLYLALFCKKPKQSEIILKNKDSRVFVCKQACNFFCYKTSSEFKTYQLLINNVFIFKKHSDYQKYVNPLKKSGIDVNLPIFKIELYKNKLAISLLKQLNTLYNLDKQNVKLNLILFVDETAKIKKLNNILNLFNFKNIKVRVYHCLDVNFNLLASINYFNVSFNSKNNCLEKINKSSLVMQTAIKNIDAENKDIENKKFKNNEIKINEIKNNYTKTNENYTNKPSLKHLNGNLNEIREVEFNNDNQSFFYSENTFFVKSFYGLNYFNDFSYSNFCLTSNINQKKLSYMLQKTYDYKNCFETYLLKITNNSNTKLLVNYGFETKKASKHQNDIVVFSYKNKKTVFYDAYKNKFYYFYNAFKNIEIKQTSYKLYSIITIPPQSSVEIRFLASKTDNLLPDKLKELENINLFEQSKKLYLKLNTTKVLSENKTINYLINEFLPNRIIKNFINQKPNSNNDFYSLINKIFKPNLINKNLVSSFPQKFFLATNNLYSVYFNLLYFYFGVFVGKTGFNFNTDKSLILNNSSLRFEVNETKKILNLKNQNLKNEIEINNIKYSNLDFLYYENLNNDNLEVFY